MLKLNTPIISSYCHWDEPQCAQVEWTDVRGSWWQRFVFGAGTIVELRDTKLGEASPVVRFTPREWRQFLVAVPAWRPAADRRFRVVDLAFTKAEWWAFRDGVAAGEFDLPTALRVATPRPLVG
jgi:Domain of unknown function (DUF397)